MAIDLMMRADARASAGLGHVMRCIALAEQCVNRGGAAWLLSEAVPDRVGRYCRNAGIQRITVARHCPDDELVLRHCARMRAALGADPVCVLDGYDLGAGLREAIRSAGFSLVVIDDNADKGPYRADVVVNPNVYANAGDYGVDPDTEYLCGPAYHLLREEIRGTRRRSVHPERARRVLVNMGGTDPHDHASAAMESLISIGAADISSLFLNHAYRPRYTGLARFQSPPSTRSSVQKDRVSNTSFVPYRRAMRCPGSIGRTVRQCTMSKLWRFASDRPRRYMRARSYNVDRRGGRFE